jgi:predicted enzyme related to lactoylglutathione lyase
MGRFIWHDLMTVDLGGARAFYGELCGWQFDELRLGGVTVLAIRVGERRVGALMPEKDIPASHWIPHLPVENTDAACARVSELGGKVCVPPMAIPRLGRFAVAEDREGALFSPLRRPDGTPPPPDPGLLGSFAWDNLLTVSPESAIAFYRELAGWSFEPRDGSFVAERALITQQRQPEHGSGWFPFINIADVDSSTERALSLGGKAVLQPRSYAPLDRFSVLLDPSGAVFGLTQNA